MSSPPKTHPRSPRNSLRDLLHSNDIRKKKFCTLFPEEQQVHIVVRDTSIAYCLKVLHEEKIHSVPVVDRLSESAYHIVGLVDMTDICFFITNAYLCQLELAQTNFKYIFHRDIQLSKAVDIINASDDNHLKLLKYESVTFYEILDILSKPGYGRVILLGPKGLFQSENKRKIHRLVTRSDILRFIKTKSDESIFDEILSQPVSFCCNPQKRNIITVSEIMNTAEGFRLMLSHQLHGLPVVNSEEVLVGNLNARDVNIYFADKEADLGSSIRDFLERVKANNCYVLVTCTMNDKIQRAVDLMIENRVHRVWVVNENNHVISVISATDICRLVAHENKEKETITTNITEM